MEAISESLIPLELELQARRKVLGTELGCFGEQLRSLQKQYALLTMEVFLQPPKLLPTLKITNIKQTHKHGTVRFESGEKVN